VPIQTRSGLILRFDEARLETVIFPLKHTSQYEDLLTDVYLWTQLHIQLSQLAAMVTALLTHSWQFTLVSALVGSLAGRLISEFGYSDCIRRVGQIGSWMTGIVVCLVLAFTGRIDLSLTIVGVVLANGLAVPSMVLFPLICLVTRSRFRQTKMLMPERTFVIVCNRRAARLGMPLNWALYDGI
jgi:hypothetical protein